MRTKNILITGASSGIGEYLAYHYAHQEAANLYLCGRNEDRLKTVAERCQKLGCLVSYKIIDVRNAKDTQQWIEECEQLSPLNLIIANAGVATLEENSNNIRNTFATNLGGVINTVLPAIEILKNRQGPHRQIAMISSIAGYHGLPTCPSYSASKAGVKAWGEALRVDLRKRYGIKVNVICPGFVRSRITAKNHCPMPFLMDTDKAASLIANQLDKNIGLIAFPLPIRFATWLISILPNRISDFIYSLLPYKV